MGLSVQVLGTVQVLRDGHVMRLPEQAIVLLAGLALSEGEPVPQSRMLDLLWPARPPRTARTQVQNVISLLRRALRAPGEPTASAPWDSPVRLEPAGYRLRLPPGRLDVQVFRDEVLAGRRRAALGQRSEAAEHYRRALLCWPGGVGSGPDRPLLGELYAELGQRYADAVEAYAEAVLLPGAPGHHLAELLPQLQRALVAHPFRERLRGHLMRALWASGRRAEALQVYHEGRSRLSRELGVDPGPELQQLQVALLRAGERSVPARR